MTNVVASILARLKNIAKENGLVYNDVLRRYATERILKRIELSPYSSQCIDNVANLGKRRQPIAVAEASPLFFNHEPESRASRKRDWSECCRRATQSLRLWLATAALAPPPLQRGYARASVTKTRVPRDTKTCQPHVDARKSFGRYSNVH